MNDLTLISIIMAITYRRIMKERQAYNKHGKNKTQEFWLESLKSKDHLGHQGLDLRITLKEMSFLCTLQ
jgi:hypothetical protein